MRRELADLAAGVASGDISAVTTTSNAPVARPPLPMHLASGGRCALPNHPSDPTEQPGAEALARAVVANRRPGAVVDAGDEFPGAASRARTSGFVPETASANTESASATNSPSRAPSHTVHLGQQLATQLQRSQELYEQNDRLQQRVSSSASTSPARIRRLDGEIVAEPADDDHAGPPIPYPPMEEEPPPPPPTTGNQMSLAEWRRTFPGAAAGSDANVPEPPPPPYRM